MSGSRKRDHRQRSRMFVPSNISENISLAIRHTVTVQCPKAICDVPVRFMHKRDVTWKHNCTLLMERILISSKYHPAAILFAAARKIYKYNTARSLNWCKIMTWANLIIYSWIRIAIHKRKLKLWNQYKCNEYILFSCCFLIILNLII